MFYRNKKTKNLIRVEHNESGSNPYYIESLDKQWMNNIKQSELDENYIKTDYSNIKPYDMFIIDEYYSTIPEEKSIFQKGKIYIATNFNDHKVSCTNGYDLRIKCFDIRIINFDTESTKKINIDDKLYEIKFEKVVTPKFGFGQKFIHNGKRGIVIDSKVTNGLVTYNTIFENDDQRYVYHEFSIESGVY